MSIRKAIFAVALLGAVAVPAFATSNSYVPDRGEATYSGPMPGDAIKEARQSNFTVARFPSGYVSDRGEATYSGPAPRNTVHQASDTNSRVMGASSGMPLSRAQVLNDLEDFQRNQVTFDGYRFINGEIGYVYVGPTFSRK